MTSVGSGAGLTGGPITGTGTIALDTSSIGSCTGATQKVLWNATGNRLACGTDGDVQYTAAAPLSLTGTTFGLGSAGCTAGEVWKWNGTAWECDSDANTLYVAGSGLVLAGTTFSANLSVVQARIFEACGLDSAMTKIVADGQVSCSTFWHPTGNGASPLDFVGTTNTVPLTLKVNNSVGLRLFAASTPNFVGGSVYNNVSAGVVGAAIGGGGSSASASDNRVTDSFGTVAGGEGNVAGDDAGTADDAEHASVGGGLANLARGGFATVAGGQKNRADDLFAAVGGGAANIAEGKAAAIPGGQGNTASGNYSFAAGRSARALHDGSFVWADDGGSAASSTGPDQFIVRAGGGVWFGATSTPGAWTPGRFINTSTGAFLSTGGVWTDSSDRDLKENFRAVDGRAVLAQVVDLPIMEWNYKVLAQARHIGPMAQDFHAAFGLGEDDRHIAALDSSGVALAAIQGLHAVVMDQDARLHEQAGRIADLEARMAALDARLQGVLAWTTLVPAP